MKKILASFLLMGVVIFSAAQTTIKDANAEKRSVSDYHGVAVSGNIELFLSQGNEESVVISADDTKWRDKVVTEVKDGILQIHMEHSEENRIQFEWPNAKKIRAYVAVKTIDYLSSSGSGKTHIDGKIKTDNMKIVISGSGNVDGGLIAKDFSLVLSGSANADLAGSAEKSTFTITGSGNIRSYDFSTTFCTATISGSGNVKITVTKELSAHISGSGNILIKGDGMMRDYSASGSGKFKRVN
ncbi:MAG TPA: head GIN domain-containing protein [Chitinophagaceae bacterium]|jgi:hypothetical protein